MVFCWNGSIHNINAIYSFLTMCILRDNCWPTLSFVLYLSLFLFVLILLCSWVWNGCFRCVIDGRFGGKTNWGLRCCDSLPRTLANSLRMNVAEHLPVVAGPQTAARRLASYRSMHGISLSDLLFQPGNFADRSMAGACQLFFCLRNIGFAPA